MVITLVTIAVLSNPGGPERKKLIFLTAKILLYCTTANLKKVHK